MYVRRGYVRRGYALFRVGETSDSRMKWELCRYVRRRYVSKGYVRREMWVLLPKVYVREEIPRRCVRTMEVRVART